MENKEHYNYNDIPVFYCKKCLSLAIKDDDDGMACCNDCGDIRIGRTTIDAWEKQYIYMYGEPYIKK